VYLPFPPQGTAFFCLLFLNCALLVCIHQGNRHWQFVVTRSDMIRSLITKALGSKSDFLANESAHLGDVMDLHKKGFVLCVINNDSLREGKIMECVSDTAIAYTGIRRAK